LAQLVFFRNLSLALIALAGVSVLTQLLVATSKGCLQGTHDLRGSNLVIVLEEVTFLPPYAALLLLAVAPNVAMIAGLILSDLATAAFAWSRLASHAFFANLARPSFAVARSVYTFGLRGQVGALIALLNLRLDFTILAALAGPAVLGAYAIASKYAELLRLPPLALAWVLYPRYARAGEEAAARARSLLPLAGGLTVCAALPLALLAPFLLPLVYGSAFRDAALPAQILVVGLSLEGMAGVAYAFLYGRGRPGLNSLSTAAGLAITVLLDLLLIPRYGAVGAAFASSAAYLTVTGFLLVSFWRVSSARPAVTLAPQAVSE
jgi:O-antigen/teichoic acid export membrane protein